MGSEIILLLFGGFLLLLGDPFVPHELVDRFTQCVVRDNHTLVQRLATNGRGPIVGKPLDESRALVGIALVVQNRIIHHLHGERTNETAWVSLRFVVRS